MSRILMLCNTFPPNIGGSERVLGDLASGLAQPGHEVIVFTPSADNERAPELSGKNLRVVRSRAWRRLHALGGSKNKLVSRAARAAITLLVLFRARRLPPVDVIIAGHILPLGLVALKLNWHGHGSAVLAITYGEDVTVYARGRRMHRHMVRVLEEADAITCSTRDSKAEIAALAPASESKVHVIPGATLEAASIPELEVVRLRDSLGGGDRLLLLTVARLVPRKGIDTTLRALTQLQHQNLMYVIVGDGPDRSRLESLAAELGVAEKVRFVGSVSDARPYYAACDIFCMPNRQMPDGEREGFGIVFLEAGVAGKPVIGGRSGGAQDAILENETGLLVNPEDVNEIAAAISKLAGDAELRARLGARGRTWAANFTAERLVHQYDVLIKNLLADATA